MTTKTTPITEEERVVCVTKISRLIGFAQSASFDLASPLSGSYRATLSDYALEAWYAWGRLMEDGYVR